MTAPLRAAVIGLGVGERHIEGFEADPRCRVVALCDRDPDKLADVAARHPGRRLATDAREILLAPDIDVVSIAGFDDSHRDHVVSAIECGKHVFVEKPLCLTEEEMADIRVALARRPGVRLSSNLILRRSPRFAAWRRRLAEGDLGTLYYIEANYDYGRLWKLTDGWRGDIEHYSVMLGGGLHMVDLILWMTGERVREVSAFGTNIATQGSRFRHHDTVAALLRCESGMVAKVTSNFACVLPHGHRLELYGTAGTFLQTPLGTGVVRSRNAGAEPEPVVEPYPGCGKGDLIPSFVGAILDGGDPEVPERDVFDAMAVCLAIDRAARERCTIQVCYD